MPHASTWSDIALHVKARHTAAVRGSAFDGCCNLHRMLQGSSSSSTANASAFTLNATVKGLGPAFLLTLALCNSGPQPVSDAGVVGHQHLASSFLCEACAGLVCLAGMMTWAPLVLPFWCPFKLSAVAHRQGMLLCVSLSQLQDFSMAPCLSQDVASGPGATRDVCNCP